MNMQRKLNQRERMAYATVARLEAERDALQIQLTSTDEHNDRLIAAINKVRNTVCLPASIEAVLIAALDRKEKN